MGKYTLGVLITAISVGILIVALTSNYVAGLASIFLVFGVAYMISGLAESIIVALRN